MAPRYVLCIGAHPDDNESAIGGTIAHLSRAGWKVKMLSVTDGRRGHFLNEYIRNPAALIERRREESLRAAALVGAEYDCMNVPDGEVYVTPELTNAMVRIIRGFGPSGAGPDLVLLNRPNDYHRDHRYTAQLVLDATYMLTVPPMCPEVGHLSKMPVFAYWQDRFTEGCTFRPDVVVPIDRTIDTKVEMVCAHESQFFEWLPFNDGVFAEVPNGEAERTEWIRARYFSRAEQWARKLGAPISCVYAEAFQISEYGAQPADAKELFGVN